MEEDTAEAAEERDPIEEAEICVDSAAELKARVFAEFCSLVVRNLAESCTSSVIQEIASQDSLTAPPPPFHPSPPAPKRTATSLEKGSSSCPRFLQLSRPSEADDTLASLNGRMLEGRRVRLQRYGQERERRGLSNRDVLHSIYFPSSSREARRALDNSLHDSWRWRSRRARVLSSQIRTKKQSGELSAHKRREPEPRPSKLVDLSLDLGVSNLNLDLLPSHSLHSTLALHLLFSYPALLRRHSPLVYDRRRSVDLDLGGSNGDRGRSGLSVERGGSGLSGVVDGGGMGRSLTGGSVDGGREWFEEERSLRTLRRRLEVDGEWSYSARS